MATAIKILNGTRSGEILCKTCSRGFIAKGPSESHEMIRCDYVEGKLPFPVIECSHYSDKNQTSLVAMADTAWILDPSSRKTSMGFKPPKEWRTQNPKEDIIPDNIWTS